MFYKAGDPRRRIPTGFFWGSAASLAALGTLGYCFGGGNEHGASHTDLDTMPSWSVEQEEQAKPQDKESIPPAASKAARLVCRGIFVDKDSNPANIEIIVNPIVDPSSHRPLELRDITPSGPDFAAALPRDNFDVYQPNGQESATDQLDNCAKQKFVVRSVVDGPWDHVLVSPDSGIDNGDSVDQTIAGAADEGLINHRLYLTDSQFDEQFAAFDK